MEFARCKECDTVYGYIDSPPADNCACGGELEIVEVGNVFNIDMIDYPTVSC